MPNKPSEKEKKQMSEGFFRLMSFTEDEHGCYCKTCYPVEQVEQRAKEYGIELTDRWNYDQTK